MGENEPRVFYGWWVVSACFVLLFLFAGAGFYSFSIFIQPLEDEFGWSRAAVSLTMSIYFIVSGLVGPLMGKWIQTHGPKRVMALSALATGACFLLVSLTPALWYLYALYAFLAMANCGMGIIPVSSVIAAWFVRRRGTAIGLAMVGISLGGLVLTPVIGLITARFSWRASFIVLGLLVWALALPAILFVIRGSPDELGLEPDGRGTSGNEPSPAEPPSPSAAGELRGWPLKAALRSRPYRWIAATFFLAPMAQMGVLQHQVPLIAEAGLTQAAAAFAMGLTAGMGGLGKVGFGRITETVPFRYAAAFCFGLQALAVLLFLATQSVAMVWVYVLLFGFAMGGVIVLLPLIVGHFFGLASFGVLVGTLMLTQALGGSIGAYASGLIHDHFGSYQLALTAFVGVYLAAIVTIFLARRPEPYTQ
jgi:sugar phosphate permease